MTKPRKRLPERKLIPFPEPRLRFGFDQLIEDPKDGLLLFGPPEKPLGTDYGVIGTAEGIRQFEAWAARLQQAVPADPKVTSSITFPGFETIFRTLWNPSPRVKLTVDSDELENKVNLTDPHQRVFDTVDLFAKPIARWVKEEDDKVAMWFVVVPEEVWKLCRPRSTVTKDKAVQPDVRLTHAKAFELQQSPDLFDDMNEAAKKHLFENHFHNQLKAKLLDCEAVTQIVRQTTIAPLEYLTAKGERSRKMQDDATIAWNLATGIFYKAGAKPWTLADIRDGVCYIGLVFKRTNNPNDAREACCGAQMFLKTGEGIVFKGAVGSWASDKEGEYHLSEEKAREIVERCIAAYKVHHNNKAPRELFIHGRTRFDKNEIRGFRSGAPDGTTVSGIQILRPNDLKLFREGKKPMLRGSALKLDNRNAFLWSSGYVPHLLTYPGREVPTPIKIRIVFGASDIEQVVADILALTKVNFNACIFGDGLPVTLRFADDIGEILTAIPEVTSKPLMFRHYI
ncbi:hypothetical protein [Bradyrhizobium sp. CCGUVB14]|uniref:argonaute/piwi family protein n=1 Tax=Bradyrhizobium sp. CCGUVB14 TaxID=2949628 RepID=UPI0020B431C0|nr:hypothetical protein [Bradyrhizobium sp. CCGUVB14]MCP3447345.1 hypothetical protein [Bradyrhizobium sp. CCGUVB14]